MAVSSRLLFTVGHNLDLGSCNALYAQEFFNRLGTTLGQCNVVLAGAALVSMTFQTYLGIAVAFQVVGVGTQRLEGSSGTEESSNAK